MWKAFDIEAKKKGQTVSVEVRGLILASLPLNARERIAKMESCNQAIATPPNKTEEQPKKWYDGMPFLKGGAK